MNVGPINPAPKKRGRPATQPCGTVAAASRHRYRNEPLCALCAQAARDYQRRFYRKQQAAKGLVVQDRPRKQPVTLIDVARLIRQRTDIENALKIGPDIARILTHACRQNGLI